MVTHEYTYAYAAVTIADGRLDTLMLPHVNGACMQLFLNEVALRHANERIVMVLDGAGWHQNHWLCSHRVLIPIWRYDILLPHREAV
jgi:transposase-like protein